MVRSFGAALVTVVLSSAWLVGCSDEPACARGVAGCDGPGGASGASTTTSTVTTSATGGADSTSNSGGAGGAGGGGSTSSTGGAGGAETVTATQTSTASGPQQCVATSEACGECVLDACNGELCGCVAEKGCVDLRDCLAACGGADDTDCIFDCFKANPTFIGEVARLGSCVADSCGTKGGECAKATPLEPCGQCTVNACEVEFEACNSDAACNALFKCVAKCADGDSGCQSGCALANSGGLGKAQAVQKCLQANCKSECPGI